MRIWQKWALGVAGLVVVVTGLHRLRVEADILATLPSQLPEVQGLKMLRDAFAGGDDLVIGLEARDAETAKAAAEALARRLEEAPHVGRVRSAGTLESGEQAGALLAWALQNAPAGSLEKTRERLTGDQLETHLQDVMERLAGSPELADVQRWSYDPLGLLETLDPTAMETMQESGFNLASADGAFRLVLVEPATPLTGYREAADWVQAIRERAAAWPEEEAAFRDTVLHFTGEPAFLAETGSGIENDMRGTIGITEVLITLLFWIMFRRLRRLLWIQLLLGVVMLLTLALAGWFFGHVSVMSLGFAAILLGIVVDYAVLILQEARDHPELSAAEVRRRAAPGLCAGAGTTAVVFLSLIFGGLPGLADLGLLVALGVVVGLGVMLGIMPHLMKDKAPAPPQKAPVSSSDRPPHHGRAAFATAALVLAIVGILAWRGWPAYHTGPEALRPTRSAALAAWEVVQQRLGQDDHASVPLLVTGEGETLRAHAAAVASALEEAKARGTILGYALPTPLLPDEAAQRAQRADLEWFVEHQSRLDEAVLAAGFTEEALSLFHHVTAAWRRALAAGWPQPLADSTAAEVLGRFISSPPGESARRVALGSVSVPGAPGHPSLDHLAALQQHLRPLAFAHLTGWESLGLAMSELVRGHIVRLTLPLVAVLIFMLAVTFRNVRDVGLSLAMLALGLAALAATMSGLGLSWNLASLAALPLLLGTGIDYGIHILLALGRTGNNLRLVRATTARAVFFSGMTTVIGFASLTAAGNNGIASLGVACCLGTGWILLLVLGLLPYWRVWLNASSATVAKTAPPASSDPSSS